MADEKKITITGVTGDICSPTCSATSPCPTDYPAGVAAGTVGKCVLETPPSQTPTNCVLECPVAGPSGCGAKASCKAVAGAGVNICTYDS